MIYETIPVKYFDHTAEEEEEILPDYQVWFNEGDEVQGGFKSYEDLKEYFDICCSSMEEYGEITIEAPVKYPYKIACYVFDRDDIEIENDEVYDLFWEKEESEEEE
jgi:hypothetical protein